MIKKLLYTFLLVGISLTVAAQPVTPPAPAVPIQFLESTHDFGTVKMNAPCETVFKFKNTSANTVTLQRVKASCGCTTPTWTKEAVKPGETGEISVKYNSSRAGEINKSVQVWYDTTQAPVIVYIKGKVEAEAPPVLPGQENKPAMNQVGSTPPPANMAGTNPVAPSPPVVPPTPPADNRFTNPRGALSFEKMIENAGEVASDKTVDVIFRFKNVSPTAVTLSDKFETDGDVTVKLKEKVVQPGAESFITVTIDGKKMKDNNATPGYFNKRIGFSTDEKENAMKYVSVNGTFKRVFSAAEVANSPKIEFELTEVNGGKIIEGETFEYKFKFTNTGKSDLMISSAKASCGCTATKPPVDAIKPGESDYIVATFNSQGRIGTNSKSITVTSNDVNNPNVTLKFTVEVEKDPFHAGGLMQGGEGHDHDHDHEGHEGHGH